ncbi:hypothetical protein GDO86_015495 [Hymenochirus boettgeri]|uniref:Transmembrane protein n=1 Tax=Hymenochirus boettgeri TaxID=247094 RepID=A0A8T2JYH8_9PIPI|nr:hypothetical protein GDO86_015495 [Hymenochirus boettgeri]
MSRSTSDGDFINCLHELPPFHQQMSLFSSEIALPELLPAHQQRALYLKNSGVSSPCIRVLFLVALLCFDLCSFVSILCPAILVLFYLPVYILPVLLPVCLLPLVLCIIGLLLFLSSWVLGLCAHICIYTGFICIDILCRVG